MKLLTTQIKSARFCFLLMSIASIHFGPIEAFAQKGSIVGTFKNLSASYASHPDGSGEIEADYEINVRSTIPRGTTTYKIKKFFYLERQVVDPKTGQASWVEEDSADDERSIGFGNQSVDFHTNVSFFSTGGFSSGNYRVRALTLFKRAGTTSWMPFVEEKITNLTVP